MASSRNDLARIAGPDSMAKPPLASSSTEPHGSSNTPAAKKKKHRGGRKHKNRRTSFAAPSETTDSVADMDDRPSLLSARPSGQQSSFYRVQNGNRSNTSLESEALLDHREHDTTRPRRTSLQQSAFTRPSLPFQRHRNSQASAHPPRQRHGYVPEGAIVEDDDAVDTNDRTPLLGMSKTNRSRPDLSRNNSGPNYGSHGVRTRRTSAHSKASSRKRLELISRGNTEDSDYDVNNPPSVPNSPKLGSLDDVMIADLNGGSDRGRDAIITIDDDSGLEDRRFSMSPDETRRRATVADMAERDVCFPGDVALSEVGEGEGEHGSAKGSARKRRRGRQWPDFEALEDWAREEKEERTHQEQIRVKKIKEPAMVGGRLRAQKTFWHREEEDAPFRFTYFNEVLDGTIHARTISDLLQDGLTFRDLFLPGPMALDSESEEDDENALERHHQTLHEPLPDLTPKPSPAPSDLNDVRSPSASKSGTGSNTPQYRSEVPTPVPRPARDSEQRKRYGARPTFWLDVLNPTDLEMKVISKAFGIHQLTTEDILVSEQREKVELFSNYYFVNYRSFEQDKDSEDYMEPVNMYVVVFRDGVITFHHTMTPHPANVRRRIRQLNDYMSPTADWISYAIIDDVTDVYAPLVADIEQEVDDIDDDILYMQSDAMGTNKNKGSSGPKIPGMHNEKSSQPDISASRLEDKTGGQSSGDMLRRVGECRKKVMGMYRLLGNKADVIKGFAKRCNEHWEVAPRSEIGLYLGDIQDHIVTMTGNLSHYENLLSRAHGNYLAQINIRMNERAEQTADVLGKLTVLGTIVLPMNIITGMWGMNVWVPGQDAEHDLTWFWCITAGLLAFGLSCYFIAKKVYGIV